MPADSPLFLQHSSFLKCWNGNHHEWGQKSKERRNVYKKPETSKSSQLIHEIFLLTSTWAGTNPTSRKIFLSSLWTPIALSGMIYEVTCWYLSNTDFFIEQPGSETWRKTISPSSGQDLKSNLYNGQTENHQDLGSVYWSQGCYMELWGLA